MLVCSLDMKRDTFINQLASQYARSGKTGGNPALTLPHTGGYPVFFYLTETRVRKESASTT